MGRVETMPKSDELHRVIEFDIKKGLILQGTKTNMVHCLPFDISIQPT